MTPTLDTSLSRSLFDNSNVPDWYACFGERPCYTCPNVCKAGAMTPWEHDGTMNLLCPYCARAHDNDPRLFNAMLRAKEDDKMAINARATDPRERTEFIHCDDFCGLPTIPRAASEATRLGFMTLLAAVVVFTCCLWLVRFRVTPQEQKGELTAPGQRLVPSRQGFSSASDRPFEEFTAVREEGKP